MTNYLTHQVALVLLAAVNASDLDLAMVVIPADAAHRSLIAYAAKQALILVRYFPYEDNPAVLTWLRYEVALAFVRKVGVPVSAGLSAYEFDNPARAEKGSPR